MNWMNDRNREQLLGMQDLLDLYEDRKIPLHTLVNSLTSKQNGMINVEKSWTAEFERNWLKLEICNALALDAAERNEEIDLRERQKSAVTGMRGFLTNTINKFPNP